MGKTFLKIATVYFTIGVLMGIMMGIMQNFQFKSIHAHINLLGWVSMALFGLIYHFYPKAANTKLAKTHFWLHNIGLPFMTLAIVFEVATGSLASLPFAIVGSIAVVIGVILFMINIFRCVGKES